MKNRSILVFSRSKIVLIFFLILYNCNDISKKKVIKEFELEGDSISKNLIISSFNDNIRSFNDLPKPSVIMRYSELNCGVCVDSTVAYVKKLEQNLGIPVTYISSYSNRRDVILFKELNGIGSNIYKTNFISKYDSLNYPYLYVIDKDFVQKSLYFPKKENMGDFMLYLRYITKKYFEDNLKNDD